MKIGIFGGSFDPIHLGHLIVAEYTKELMNLDKIIFIPVGNPSHRENSLSSWEHRLKMIELSIEDNPSFEVSKIEILSNKKNYTYDTLIELKKNYPTDEIFEIIGEDFLREKLLKMYDEKFKIKSKDDEIKELKAEIERLKNAKNNI